MTDVHQQIGDLEDEIDTLAHLVVQCRKSMVVAKVVIGAGVLLFVASLIEQVTFGPMALVIGVTATVAGIGLYGSSQGSMEKLIEKIKACEARRADMIDTMDLRMVQD